MVEKKPFCVVVMREDDTPAGEWLGKQLPNSPAFLIVDIFFLLLFICS